MVILGIDPGTATTGYGIIKVSENKKRKISEKDIKYLDSGIISTQPQTSTEFRLQELYNHLLRLIKQHQPDFLAVESLYFFKNLKTAMPVSEARGVILLAGAKKRVKICQFTPLQVKMVLCGYGRADKKQIQKMVKKTLHLKDIIKPDDAADALAIAICCAFNH